MTPRRPLLALLLALPLGASTAAIDLDVTPNEMEQLLALARGPQAAVDAFHARYRFQAPAPVEAIDVITERRRLMLLAAERIALGDPLFTRGTLRAEEALRPWRRLVAIAVRLAFPPNNAYTLAPPIDIALTGGAARRTATTAETLFGLPGPPGQPQPVVGARAEAVFDAADLARATRTIVVTIGGEQVVRLVVDFGPLE
jgi:hypothetical protein